MLGRIRAGSVEGLTADEIRAGLVGSGITQNDDATETQPRGVTTQQQLATLPQHGAAALAVLEKLSTENAALREQVAEFAARLESIERGQRVEAEAREAAEKARTAPPRWQYWRMLGT